MGPVRQPLFVFPGEVLYVADNGRIPRWLFEVEAHGIGSEGFGALCREDCELVESAFIQAGDKELPDPASWVEPHGVVSAVPFVKWAHDGHSPRVGGPDGKESAPASVYGSEVSSQMLEDLKVLPLADEMALQLSQKWPEAVGIPAFPGVFPPSGSYPVGRFPVLFRDIHLEKSFREDPPGLEGSSFGENLNVSGSGFKETHPYLAPFLEMGAQKREGVFRESLCKFLEPCRKVHACSPH